MKIETIPSYRIAYIRRIDPYGNGNVQTMERLKKWAASHDLLRDHSVILGIAHDDPATAKAESCRYDTCIVIADDYRVPSGDVKPGNIQGGRYAVFQISHTAEAVQTAWANIFPEINKNYQWDETRPVLERYTAEMVANHYCEICVPIR